MKLNKLIGKYIWKEKTCENSKMILGGKKQRRKIYCIKLYLKATSIKIAWLYRSSMQQKIQKQPHVRIGVLIMRRVVFQDTGEKDGLQNLGSMRLSGKKKKKIPNSHHL